MSRTRRRKAFSLFRSPKGGRQARAAGARAIPPTAWDDLPVSGCREAVTPVMRLLEKSIGRPWSQVRARIHRSFGRAAAEWAESLVRPAPVCMRSLRPVGWLMVDAAGMLRLHPGHQP